MKRGVEIKDYDLLNTKRNHDMFYYVFVILVYFVIGYFLGAIKFMLISSR